MYTNSKITITLFPATANIPAIFHAESYDGIIFESYADQYNGFDDFKAYAIRYFNSFA